MEPRNGNLGGDPKDKLERNGAADSLTGNLMVSKNFTNLESQWNITRIAVFSIEAQYVNVIILKGQATNNKYLQE